MENNNDIFSEYHYCYNKYSFKDDVEISYIKKAFKNTIVSMYIMISYLRKKIKWLNQYSMTMEDVFNSEELKNFFGMEYIEQLKKCFIKMIFYWDKIELLLKKNDIPLSTRCHQFFSYQKLNDMLSKEYNTVNLMNDILVSINDLNTAVSNGWRIIDKKYE